MKNRNVLYVIISIVCVAAIAIAVYYQIFETDSGTRIEVNETNILGSITGTETIDLEKIKNEFNNLFTNELYLQGNDVSTVQKINEGLDVVYSAFELKEEKEDIYNVNINIPVFNISGEIASDFNATTQTLFANKASEILNGAEEYTIYNVEYVAYVNDNIISLVIKSILKEGSSAQRIIVQTYNYDIQTGQRVTLNNVLEEKQIDKNTVNSSIEQHVAYANAQAETVSSLTYQTVYKRDLNNAMYVTDNVSNFFIGENGKIYIVYAYGNTNFTSEMDIIIVE